MRRRSTRARCDHARLARAQRSLPQAGGSNNRARARTARVHARIADRHRDFLHELSTRLVRENHAVVTGDLHVRSMMKNRSLARARGNAHWAQLRSMLEYESRWHGRELIVIDRWTAACGAGVAPTRRQSAGHPTQPSPRGWKKEMVARAWWNPGLTAGVDRQARSARTVSAVTL
ncbi:transposase [Actinosynnema sp. NPDC023794]